MATLDYERRLRNIESRRFDRELNESVLSKSFSSIEIPKNIKYLMESTRAIEDSYNARTFEAARRVQNHLEAGYNLHFKLQYKTQGSVTTKTNIKVHSDFDLLNIINRYHYTSPDLPVKSPYTATNPNEDIESLRLQSTKILRSIYDEVDTSGAKSISIFNKSLNRKVDVVFCFWYNTKDYEENQTEYYRGIYLYDFTKKRKIVDFPFAHIHSVNYKGDQTLDGSRKGVRLLKTLKADSKDTESPIDLNSFHLTSIVHAIDNSKLRTTKGEELKIASAISEELNVLINNPNYRKSIKSPNSTENPLSDDSTVPEMIKLKSDLDILIEDTKKEIYGSILQKRMLTY